MLLHRLCAFMAMLISIAQLAICWHDFSSFELELKWETDYEAMEASLLAQSYDNRPWDVADCECQLPLELEETVIAIASIRL